MKTTKFQRITALMLALVFLLCSGVVAVGAEDPSASDTSANSIRELLNAISYNEYIAQYDNVPTAEKEYVIDATTGWSFKTASGATVKDGADVDKNSIAYVDVFGDEEVKGLYTPSSGTVTWDLRDVVINGGDDT